MWLKGGGEGLCPIAVQQKSIAAIGLVKPANVACSVRFCATSGLLSRLLARWVGRQTIHAKWGNQVPSSVVCLLFQKVLPALAMSHVHPASASMKVLIANSGK